MIDIGASSMPLKTWRILRFIVIIYAILIYGAHRCSCCTTPDGKTGDCRAINLCQSLLDIIRSKGISSPEVLSFMRASTCGYDGENPKVCCPPYNYEFIVSSRPELLKKSKPSAAPYTQSYILPTARPVSNKIPEGRINSKTPVSSKNVSKSSQSSDKSNSKNYTSSNSLLPRECGREQPKNKIVGGDLTDIDEFPWMALMQYHSGNEVINGCGGVLINKRYVLTAAHCLLAIPSGWSLRYVLLGEHDTRTNPDCFDFGTGEDCADHVLTMTIEQQVTHPKYGKPSAFSNDIALMRLNRDVEMTRFVQPVCLPHSSKPSEVYWASGWGQTETQAQSDIKLKVRLPYVDFQKCAKLYATKHFYLGDGQMCAGGSYGSDTCRGDSGGPLMRQERTANGLTVWVVEGLVSIGHSPCGIQGWPGVYTKVQYYASWIKSHLKP